MTMIWYFLGRWGVWRRMFCLGVDITRKPKQSMPLRELTGEFREAKDYPRSKAHKLLGLDEPFGPVTTRMSSCLGAHPVTADSCLQFFSRLKEPRARYHYRPGSKAHKLLGLDEPTGPVTTRRSGLGVLYGQRWRTRCTRHLRIYHATKEWHSTKRRSEREMSFWHQHLSEARKASRMTGYRLGNRRF